jgi:ATP-binding cassette, subfamily B, bacterial
MLLLPQTEAFIMKKTKRKIHNTAFYNGEIPNSPWRFMWIFSKRQKTVALTASICVIVAASLTSATNLLYKYIVDSVQTGNTSLIALLVLAYPVLLYAESVIWRLSGFSGMLWVTRVEYDVYNSLGAYTFKHSHSYFINRFAGSLLSKVDNIAESANQLIHDFLWTNLESGILILTSFILIFRVDIEVGFWFLALLCVLVVVNIKATKKQRTYSLKNALTYSVLRGHIVDAFSNISAVRQFASHEHEEDKLESLAEKSRIAHKNSWFFSEMTLVVNMTIVFLFNLIIMYTLVDRWKTGSITTGDLVLIIAIFWTISGALTRLGRMFNQTAKAIGKMREGLSELIAEYEIIDKPHAKRLKTKEGEITWNNVTFNYGNSHVFDNFNLVIPKGQRVGLVGSSGAGKTTFVSLLLRQHDLHGGSIAIDGQDIAKVTQDSLREAIAVVPQEPMLFHRTIRENIAYGKPDATDEEIIAVAKKAQAHDFITVLEKGYETLVGERGVKLSGGQKQRIAIARAMLKNAPILVLDEATSALDSESEVAIQKALHELMEGKTVVAIAHRLSTLREMDRIIVLEKGKIVEDGTHTTLTKAGGTYARLWEHQAGGFLQE